MQSDSTLTDSTLVERFESHIRDKAFPCVGAKSALARHHMQVFVAGDIRCPRDDIGLYDAVRDFAHAFRADPEPFQSFAALFPGEAPADETAFEAAMWQRLQALEAIDAARGETYDPRVSPDPDDPHFSLSFAGEGFFVVALHPAASRPARRFECPVLVFNPHDQFETLRREGRYETLRDSIIERDVALSGSANPMLARHGESSEARQYSGRVVADSWVCPFRPVH
ncbi:MAG: YqcI/YcgG family protein [Asticcacaulis sp.]|nr:YqcI/YcgG family protein [Asticcacaulis sp.]